jgi:DNA modification methylase
MMGKDGFYSIVDFRGDVIKLFQKHGWRFHAEVTVWKDPQLAAVRTKAIQLLHSQTKRDSTVSRPGLADYVLFFRKPGDNVEPVNYDGQGIPFELWTEYASPVWMDIDPSDTLQFRGGKDKDDVKHITPTQLEIWKRSIILYSNPGDIVFTPFMGIGSEVYQAVKLNRFGLGFELKESYYSQAKNNMKLAIEDKKQKELFD